MSHNHILSNGQQTELDLMVIASKSAGVEQRRESPMIEQRTVSNASRMAADRWNKLMVTPRGSVPMNDFRFPHCQAYRVRKPRITVISGSASYAPPTTTIDVTDYREIKEPARTAEGTNRSLRSIVGPLVVFAAAAMVALALSLMPASDGPAPITGPLSGQSLLHDPR